MEGFAARKDCAAQVVCRASSAVKRRPVPLRNRRTIRAMPPSVAADLLRGAGEKWNQRGEVRQREDAAVAWRRGGDQSGRRTRGRRCDAFFGGEGEPLSAMRPRRHPPKSSAARPPSWSPTCVREGNLSIRRACATFRKAGRAQGKGGVGRCSQSCPRHGSLSQAPEKGIGTGNHPPGRMTISGSRASCGIVSEVASG